MSSSRFIHKVSKHLNLLLFLFGLGLFFVLVQKVGVQEIAKNFKILGFNFLWAFIPSFFILLAQSLAWQETIEHLSHKIKLSSLFFIKIAGEAVNNISPLNWGGGDPVRIMLLKEWVPVSEGTASVVIDRTLTTLALVLFMLVGLFVTVVYFDFPFKLKIILHASVLFMLGSTYYSYHQQNQGLFSFLIRLLQKLRIKKNISEKTLKQADEIDKHIAFYYLNHRRKFILSLLYQLSTRVLGVVEIYLAAYFLNAPLTLVGAILLASITAILNMLFAFLPGTIGVLEGAYAGTFHLMGLDPATGTAVQIFRRIRTLIWGVIGFAYMGWRQRRKN